MSAQLGRAKICSTRWMYSPPKAGARVRRRAIGWLYREEGIVAEGSAAVAAAALLEGAVRNPEGPVAVVLSGSNLDAARLADVLGEA